ncbi:hypothetical protein [Methanosarcina sp. MSH10X1]|nr:hypothetical protein [Methanosarcina sp. MSH10X1]
MAKKSSTADSPKVGAACGKPQAKTPVETPAKKDVKSSKSGKKGK